MEEKAVDSVEKEDGSAEVTRKLLAARPVVVEEK